MNQRVLVLSCAVEAMVACGRANAPAGTQPSVAPAALPAYAPRVVDDVNRNEPPEGLVRIDDRGYFLMPAKWPVNQMGRYTIPVCWEPDAVNDVSARELVKDSVAKSWGMRSLVDFEGWVVCASNAAGVRVTVRDDGPDDGPHTLGLGTELDSRTGGMVLNFSFSTWLKSCASPRAQRESCIRSIAVHEFGHALGFAHEQNRKDTPESCDEPPQGEDGDTLTTPWDPHSVMNYCNAIRNNNGTLSTGDVHSLVKVYDGK